MAFEDSHIRYDAKYVAPPLSDQPVFPSVIRQKYPVNILRKSVK